MTHDVAPDDALARLAPHPRGTCAAALVSYAVYRLGRSSIKKFEDRQAHYSKLTACAQENPRHQDREGLSGENTRIARLVNERRVPREEPCARADPVADVAPDVPSWSVYRW